MRVFDASVAIPLLLVEVFSPQARALLHEAELSGDTVVAPKLLEYEISNALCKAVRRGLINANDAMLRLELFDALPITLLAGSVHHRALEIALRYNLPAAYDAHYLALAERLGCDFWTADERLVNALAGALRGCAGSAASPPTERAA
jgi:predicted nucleic acid-binding protein